MAANPPKDIFEAAENGNFAYIRRVLDRSIDEGAVKKQDSLQRTALHWAAEIGHVEVIELLMDYGADPFMQECNGRTAVHLAARGCHDQALKAILDSMEQPEDREKLVNIPDNFGITPVFLTTQKGEEGRKAFEVLMSFGARYGTTTTARRSIDVRPPVPATPA